MFTKPVTSSISPAERTCIILRSPALPVECLVHGWDAISSALDESSRLDGGDRTKAAKNIAYARKCQERVCRHPRPDITEEAAELGRAIVDAERYF